MFIFTSSWLLFNMIELWICEAVWRLEFAFNTMVKQSSFFFFSLKCRHIFFVAKSFGCTCTMKKKIKQMSCLNSFSVLHGSKSKHHWLFYFVNWQYLLLQVWFVSCFGVKIVRPKWVTKSVFLLSLHKCLYSELCPTNQMSLRVECDYHW